MQDTRGLRCVLLNHIFFYHAVADVVAARQGVELSHDFGFDIKMGGDALEICFCFRTGGNMPRQIWKCDGRCKNRLEHFPVLDRETR
jgi:hypothetical protein